MRSQTAVYTHNHRSLHDVIGLAMKSAFQEWLNIFDGGEICISDDKKTRGFNILRKRRRKKTDLRLLFRRIDAINRSTKDWLQLSTIIERKTRRKYFHFDQFSLWFIKNDNNRSIISWWLSVFTSKGKKILIILIGGTAIVDVIILSTKWWGVRFDVRRIENQDQRSKS